MNVFPRLVKVYSDNSVSIITVKICDMSLGILGSVRCDLQEVDVVLYVNPLDR